KLDERHGGDRRAWMVVLGGIGSRAEPPPKLGTGEAAAAASTTVTGGLVLKILALIMGGFLVLAGGVSVARRLTATPASHRAPAGASRASDASACLPVATCGWQPSVTPRPSAVMRFPRRSWSSSFHRAWWPAW